MRIETSGVYNTSVDDVSTECTLHYSASIHDKFIDRFESVMTESNGSGLSIIMFSGTADKFIPLGVLVQTAANMGTPVSIFVTGWALMGFLKDGYKNVNRMPTEFKDFAPALEQGMKDTKTPSWHEMLLSAKEIGDVKIYACSLMTEIFKIKSKDQLDPMVSDIVGAASFLQQSSGNQVLFI